MTHAVAGPGQVLSCQDIGWLMVNRDGRRFVDENTPAAIEAGVEEDVMWKADTLEDLAAQLGIKDTDTFLATVERYNTLCAEGHDRDFGKDDKWMKSSIVTPPFYATKVTAITMTIQFGRCATRTTTPLRACTRRAMPAATSSPATTRC